jgi:hypothetical protein
MNFIGNNDLKYVTMHKAEYDQAKMGKLTNKTLPEMVVFQFFEKDCEHMLYKENIQLVDPRGKVGWYRVDSCIVRDTKKVHFCAVLTVNGKQYGFDGASHTRLSPFDWREQLFASDGEVRDWTFDGSNFDKDPSNQIKWSFSNAYHLLFYYRVK